MVDVDEVLDLLHAERCRYLLYYLDDQDEPVHVDEVVKAVAEMERDATTIELDKEEVEEIEISLEHNHLPKTDPFDFIRYDSAERTIQLTDASYKFDTLLTVAKVLEKST